MKNIILSFLFFGAIHVFAQEIDADYQVALSFFNSQNYKKSAELFSNLYKKNSKESRIYFEKLRYSLFYLKKYDTLSTLLQREIRKQPSQFSLKLQLFECVIHSQNSYRIDSLVSSFQDNVQNNTELELVIAAMIDYQLTEQVIHFISILRTKYLNPNLFGIEFATAHKNNKNYYEATAELIRLYTAHQIDYQTIQTHISTYLTNQEKTKEIESAFLDYKKNITTQSVAFELSQLLMTIFFVNEKYDEALAEADWQDKIMGYFDNNVLAFAEMALVKNKPSIAQKAYHLVIKRNHLSRNTETARLGLAKIWLQELQSLPRDSIRMEKAEHIAETYSAYVEKYVTEPQTPKILYDLIVVYKEELNDNEKTEKSLRKFINRYTYDPLLYKVILYYASFQARNSKFEDADKLLNDFMQRFVNQKDILAEARFLMAKFSFYNLNFLKTNSILSVIETGSSSANNSISFRMFLNKAMTDTAKHTNAMIALQEYAQIERSIFLKSDTTEIERRFDLWLNTYSNLSIMVDVLFEKSSFYETYNTKKAIASYELLSEKYPQSFYADQSLFRAGKLSEKLSRFTDARKYYENLLLSYPNSLYKSKARNRIQNIPS